MKKFNLLCLLGLFSLMALAQAPAGYYSVAEGKQGDALRLALQDVIDNHTVVSYDNLKPLYIYSDTKNTESDAGTSLIDIYSTCGFVPGSGYCASSACGGGYNREHSVPKSWFNKASPMYSDAFHLYPTSCYVNSYRGNYALGVCANGTKCTTNGMTEALGRRGNCTYPGYSGVVYEPDDEYKGDLARTYFYMATRYANACSSWSGGMFGSDNNGFQTWAINMLLEWHRQDPVSTKEKIRNEAIYGNSTYNKGSYKQNNRNPFIDYPCLAEYIWGNKKGTNVDFTQILSTYSADYATTTDLSGCSCAASVPTLTAPTNASSLVVGAAGKNETVTAQLTVKGVLLTKSLSLAISGTNASLFTVSPTTVTSANALAGTTVTVSYKPTALGNHTATLTISSKELAQSTTVTLTGSCSASLVSPTTSGLVFSSDNVMVKNDQTVLVKGTNLSSTVGLSITGTNAALFKVSSASVTAADANAGKNITVSYTPTTVGSHTATLVVTSSDFTTVNVPLTGTCTFQALEATNVTKNAFNANWTNAGVTNYVLDVFKQTVVGSASVPVLTEQFNGSMSTSVSVSGFSTLTELDKTAIRIGSSSAATMTLSGLDLSNGASISLSAKMYSATDASTITLKVGTTIITTWNVTADFTTLTADIPVSSETSVTLTTGGSKPRAYIDWLIVSVGGETITNTSLTGYPKSVGNVQSYLVVGLEPSTQYYYTVTPTGVPVSEQIAVMTLEENTPTDMQYTDANALVYYATSEAVQVLNLQPGSSVMVFDTMGRLCAQRANCATEETFILPQGVYLFKVAINGFVQSAKVVR